MLILDSLQFEVERGGRFAEVLRFKQGKTPRPVDLTGRGPFTCEVTDTETEEVIAELTVEETDLADGRLTLVNEALEVDEEITRATFKVIDFYGVRWARGSLIFG